MKKSPEITAITKIINNIPEKYLGQLQAIVEAFAAYLPQEQVSIVSVAQLRIYADSFRKTLGVMIDQKLAIEVDYYHHEEDQIAALVFQFKEKEKVDIERFQEVDLDFFGIGQA